MKSSYDPSARLPLSISEVEYRKSPAGRALMARIYQPAGSGPFPTLLDLHGGAWNTKDRLANEPMDRALAESGLLVVAIDLTLAGEAHYPASVRDANFGVRWVKAQAGLWNGDATRLGILGSSTGGHVAQLIGMRPDYPLYNTHTLTNAPGIDARVAYIATRSPISDPYARYLHAEKMGRAAMVQFTQNWFKPWDTIRDANPQEFLDRGENVALPPLLVMQGSLDDNVPPAMQEKFVHAYRAAGGQAQYELFNDCEHEWVSKPGPQTDRAVDVVKAFIATQLARAAVA
jgi:acetyl esterase